MIGVFLKSVLCEAVTHYFLSAPFQNAIITDENGRMLADICCDAWRQFIWEHDSKKFIVADALSIMAVGASPLHLQFPDVRKSSRVELVPRLDSGGCVLGTYLQSRSFAEPVAAQGMIMAGGFGRRLGELTKNMPKPMLAIGDRPIAQHLLENLRDSGIRDIFMSVHYCKDALIDHFGDGSSFGVSVRYVHEDKPLGTGGCLSLITKDIESPLIVVNGDIFTDLQFHRLIDNHNASGADITVTVKRHPVTLAYGVIETNEYGSFIMREKPTFSYAINAAIYVLSPSVFNKLEIGIKIDMPTLIQHLVSLGAKVNLFPLMESWIDIGTEPELRRAQEAVDTKQRPRLQTILTDFKLDEIDRNVVDMPARMQI
ncbi:MULTISPECIES: sugar phosphate nucleotidyltransferase [unclassified Rhizobium]|uniref:nucleotidyltransferase family protein n=1 Tax=unclassified Rhizobium TaxID=2613769 RepID=UPI001AE4B90E|nr:MULTISPECIES: sugar phosphate nucleotidyltransferase [unclassified Rhizobium]MBP2460163.1 dTDP-glucose pyrophosphorylase [Rhizobium sp. PvP014]MBP2531522.1 dTDP-glucose pyrophosphorylase [Rhizobium sp. PvP099]